MTTLNVNGKLRKLNVPDDMPLLWTLRDVLNMTGTKFGCGQGLCGACTIHIDGQPTRSCVTPVSAAAGKQVTTIEAIGATRAGKKVQAAWLELDVPQCGYCQSGQIMSASALLVAKSKPSDSDIDEAMAGNICRCGTYPRIRTAMKLAAGPRKLACLAAAHRGDDEGRLDRVEGAAVNLTTQLPGYRDDARRRLLLGVAACAQ
jgi:isoquinoline 1-oxidoreductase alpha subunit